MNILQVPTLRDKSKTLRLIKILWLINQYIKQLHNNMDFRKAISISAIIERTYKLPAGLLPIVLYMHFNYMYSVPIIAIN